MQETDGGRAFRGRTSDAAAATASDVVFHRGRRLLLLLKMMDMVVLLLSRKSDYAAARARTAAKPVRRREVPTGTVAADAVATRRTPERPARGYAQLLDLVVQRTGRDAELSGRLQRAHAGPHGVDGRHDVLSGVLFVSLPFWFVGRHVRGDSRRHDSAWKKTRPRKTHNRRAGG